MQYGSLIVLYLDLLYLYIYIHIINNNNNNNSNNNNDDNNNNNNNNSNNNNNDNNNTCLNEDDQWKNPYPFANARIMSEKPLRLLQLLGQLGLGERGGSSYGVGA